MGAKLEYAKVVDKQIFYSKGARVNPGLENEIQMLEEPGRAASFLVLRSWTDDHGTFTEQWRLESPGGQVAYESLPRELHLATHTHSERLEDEVAELELEFAADDYAVVFVLDENEVARVTVPVRPPQTDESGEREEA